MDLFPIFMNLRERECLVVGGGPVAARKADLLVKAGARVAVVAPALGGEMTRLHALGCIRHLPGEFAPGLVDRQALVIAATDQPLVNRRVQAACGARNIPVNVADAPELCSFVLPAIVDRAPVTIAISSGGAAPVLARWLRARLETQIPASFGALAGLMGRFRDRVRRRFHGTRERRLFWEAMLDGAAAEAALAGRDEEAGHLLARALEEGYSTGSQGEVYLIGAGPGDPDLLTFKALRLLQKADVVVYDRLVAPQVVDLARREAERIYVGKQRNDHSMAQEDISRLLVELAGQGKRVARLKGGDPFVFGRGGEEIELIARAGIPFQVVPGITAATGCAAYAGIPLTHRDHAQSCRFITAHRRSQGLDVDWPSLAVSNETLVFYMGLSNLAEICAQLMAHGMRPGMPIALVEQGTTVNQRVLTGTLDTLPGIVAQAGARSPGLIVVGEVVRLHRTLSWFRAPMPGGAGVFGQRRPQPEPCDAAVA
ncbi:MAG: siroheme synthase CysG [Gammaproteobacteria bacterium]|nr:siroheme synthase CysG [Gammaproteobacteria bacterium]MDX5374392.1 siroheme synthase CysG [Gammaproteobacteria bacterium]